MAGLGARRANTTVMTGPLTQIENESILRLSLMAAVAEGGKSDVERIEGES
jgi:hypothetical protein